VRNRIRIIGTVILGSVLAGGAARAADVNVLAAGALQVALRNLAADYQMKTGTKVTITPTNPAKVESEMTAHPYDIVAAAWPSLVEFTEGGKLQPGSEIHLVRTGIGVFYHVGAPKPDVSTVTAFKAALKNAKTIVYSGPAANTSGAETQFILTNAGLLDVVHAKGKELGLGDGRQALAKGEAEIGLFNVSEGHAPGVALAGPVPAPLEQYINYDIAVVKGAANAKGGADFVKFVTAKAANPRWEAAGLERMSGR
jgi:molybdate transport system substrate-binding protein